MWTQRGRFIRLSLGHLAEIFDSYFNGCCGGERLVAAGGLGTWLQMQRPRGFAGFAPFEPSDFVVIIIISIGVSCKMGIDLDIVASGEFHVEGRSGRACDSVFKTLGGVGGCPEDEGC
ncbi:hypothetical protein BJY01DRAFT_211953 [Aspergillus pseudoustus]|uniref:Uncharacterized protein n=1 Tax=Aspergillus pseudoustus TaxID=1810923 RepID=A0ABR4K7V7_9EURO